MIYVHCHTRCHTQIMIYSSRSLKHAPGFSARSELRSKRRCVRRPYDPGSEVQLLAGAEQRQLRIVLVFRPGQRQRFHCRTREDTGMGWSRCVGDGRNGERGHCNWPSGERKCQSNGKNDYRLQQNCRMMHALWCSFHLIWYKYRITLQRDKASKVKCTNCGHEMATTPIIRSGIISQFSEILEVRKSKPDVGKRNIFKVHQWGNSTIRKFCRAIGRHGKEGVLRKRIRRRERKAERSKE